MIEKTPQRVKHENVLGNIHPNEAGKWIWHISMRLGANPAEQQAAMVEMIETVGTGEITAYEGGLVDKLIHMTRRLSEQEIDRVPENAANITEEFQRSILSKVGVTVNTN